jgi:hypothetical protein
MSKKKSRRARRRRTERAAPGPEAVSMPTKREKVTAEGYPRPTGIDFAEQYSYVYDDLKRIAILAGALFAILIALSFVIT